MKTTKPFYKSRTVWGLLIALASLVSVGLADAGLFEVAADMRTQLFGLSFVGLAMAGYGRAKADKALGLRGSP